jgi:hypothetical protein
MSSFADFNVGTLKLNYSGEMTQLTSSRVNTSTHTATWNDLMDTIPNVEELAQEIVLKEDLENKSTSISSDATSDSKYPSVKAIKTYVDGRMTEQNQFINTTLETLQYFQEELSSNVQSDTTKESLSNKSTNIETDAASDLKYPSVKAVKTYVDKVRSSLLVMEGESNAKGDILWTCGSCPMDGVYGLILPSNGKIRRITGIAYGPLGYLNSIQVNLNAYTIDSLTHTSPQLMRSISFTTHPTLPMLYALDKVNENTLPSTDGSIMLLLEESLPKDVSMNTVSIPPYVRVRITIEYESYV